MNLLSEPFLLSQTILVQTIVLALLLSQTILVQTIVLALLLSQTILVQTIVLALLLSQTILVQTTVLALLLSVHASNWIVRLPDPRVPDFHPLLIILVEDETRTWLELHVHSHSSGA
jgi:hypothetical protein